MDHAIKGLRVLRNTNQVGFIGAIYDDTSVKNLIIDNAVVKGKSEVACAVGRSQSGGVVERVSVTNSRVIGTGRVGGVVGFNYRRIKTGINETLSYVKRCTTDMDSEISGADETGGICGRNDGAVVIACENSADVSGLDSVGGIVGYTCSFNSGGVNGYVIASSSTENAVITGTGSAGGIVGNTYLNPGHASGGSQSYIIACSSVSDINAPLEGSFAATTHSSGYYGHIISSWSKYVDGMSYSGNGKIIIEDLISSNHYENYSDITQDIVHEMNEAISTYNQTSGVEQTCPYKWTWTEGNWPTLSVVN